MVKIVFQRGDSFFLKISFYRLLGSLKIELITCKNFIKLFWTLSNCSLTSVLPDKTRKTNPKFSSVGEIATFSESLCFQRPLRCHRNSLIACTIVINTCKPFYAKKHFSSGKVDFFTKSIEKGNTVYLQLQVAPRKTLLFFLTS